MQTMEIRALMNNIAPVLKDFVSQSLSPVLNRIDAIDKRLSELPVPRDGKDADVEATANVVFLRLKPEVEELRSILSAVEKEVMEFPVPKDGEPGKSVTVEDVFPVISEQVAKAMCAIPIPKNGEDGKSVNVEDLFPIISEQVAKAFSSVPPPKNGEDGKSITLDDIKPVLVEEVSKAVGALPVPKDGEPGKSVTVIELVPVISEQVAKAVATIPLPKDSPPIEPVAIAGAVASYLKDNPPPAGKDGTNLTDVMLDRNGNLTTVFSTGVTKTLGLVVGKDGLDGKNGNNGNDGKDGLDGKDGKDGLDGKDSELPSVSELELDEEVSKSVATALKMLAERPDMTAMMMKEASVVPPPPPVNIHLPPVMMPEIKFPAPVVNVAPAAINIPAPVVNVGDRVGKKTRNTVRKHFKDGRIQEFEQEVIG